MTTLCAPDPLTGSPFSGSTDRGQSDAYESVAHTLREARQEYRVPLSMGEEYAAAIESLVDLVADCSVEDWDAQGARPVDVAAVAQAKQFLDALPSNSPFPDVSADPDGEVSLDWFGQGRDLFSISVSPDGRLSYAGVFGPRRAHGTEFLSDEIPAPILEQLRRLSG